MDKHLGLQKTLYFRFKQPKLNLQAHFTQQQLFLLVFIIKMLQPVETNLHAKLHEKLRQRSLASKILTRTLITLHLFKH